MANDASDQQTPEGPTKPQPEPKMGIWKRLGAAAQSWVQTVSPRKFGAGVASLPIGAYLLSNRSDVGRFVQSVIRFFTLGPVVHVLIVTIVICTSFAFFGLLAYLRRQDNQQRLANENQENERQHERLFTHQLLRQGKELASGLEGEAKAKFLMHVVGLAGGVTTRPRRLDSGPHVLQTGQNSQGGYDNMLRSHGSGERNTQRTDDPGASEPPGKSAATR